MKTVVEKRKAITKTQVILTKDIYEKNIKGYYRKIKNEITAELNTTAREIRNNLENDIKKKYESLFPMLLVDVTVDTGRCYIKLYNNRDKNSEHIDNIKSIYETYGFDDCNINYNSVYSEYMKLVYDMRPLDYMLNNKYAELYKKLEENCAEYKEMMFKLNKWELETVLKMHEGIMPSIDIKAAYPEECIV